MERYTPYSERADLQLDAGPGFTGHATDVATGLTYMQQRYMDQELGRFLTPDPVGPEEDFIKHFNRYNYALNNPVRYTDPDGRKSSEEDNKPESIYVNKGELPPIRYQDESGQDGKDRIFWSYSYEERLEYSHETMVWGKKQEVTPEGIPLNLGALYEAFKDAKKQGLHGVVLDAISPDLKIYRTPIYRAYAFTVYYRLVLSKHVNGEVVSQTEFPNDYYKTMEVKVVPDYKNLIEYDYDPDLEY